MPQASAVCTDAPGQQVADAAPGGDVFQQSGDGIHIAVIDGMVDPALAGRFDGQGRQVAGGDGVHAQPVADIVQVDDLLDAVDLAQPAEGIDGFVLRPFHLQSFVAPLLDRGEPAAGHEAFEAGVRLDVALPVQGVGVDFGGAFEAPLLPVARGKAAGGVHHVHQHGGAFGLVGDHAGVLLGFGGHRARERFQPIVVGELFFSFAVEGDGLDFFGPHHGAHAGAPGAAPVVVFDNREGNQLFAGRTDADHPAIDRCPAGFA
jgi:hypothetical protein